jgi:CheY-like chemotaxis protein
LGPHLDAIIESMSRILLFIYLLIFPVLAPVTAGGQSLVNQELSIRLVPDEHRLEGRAVLTPGDGLVNWPVAFQLAPRAEIEAVTADGRPASFVFDNGVLQIATLSRTVELAINYRVRFDDPVPQDTVGIEDPSYGITATIMPRGTFLSAASGWHPLPVGAQSRFRVTIAGPPGVVGVTAGHLVAQEADDRESRMVWQSQHPQFALALAAGPYQVIRDNLGDIQLLTFMSKENTDLATGYLASIREYLQLYQTLFGPYPYAKFAVVENFYPTGYGLPGWTLLGSSLIRLPFIRSTSLPHEIAHSWWGNSVDVDDQSGNWCEGLATYVADYYLKEIHGSAEALDYRRNILREYAALIESGVDLPLSDFRSRMTKRDQAVGYGKAAMVFHMLRQLIGDQAFWNGLRAVARQGRDQRYAWRDLQRHFEASSAANLATFFHQWIDRPGAPQLQLADVSVKRVVDGWQVAGRVRQAEPGYELAVPIRLTTTARDYQQTVALSGREVDFVFNVAESPASLSVDPDYDLFRTLYPEEIPATVNHLRASRSPLVVVASGSEALLEASRDLLRGLQWQGAPVMLEEDYLAKRPSDRDVIFLGWPKNAALQAELPAGVGVSAKQFTLDDKLYTTVDDVLFMVIDSREAQHVTAYYLPGSVNAALDTARRIPHYGRYSALVFRGGRNLVKSTWQPVQSPLKLLFKKDSAP